MDAMRLYLRTRKCWQFWDLHDFSVIKKEITVFALDRNVVVYLNSNEPRPKIRFRKMLPTAEERKSTKIKIQSYYNCQSKTLKLAKINFTQNQ